MKTYFTTIMMLLAFSLIISSGSANASVVYAPMWICIGGADVVVSGKVTEMRDEGTDKMVSTISILEVIKGDPKLKTVEVRGGRPGCRGSIYPSMGQTGVWLLTEGGDRPAEPPNAATFYVFPESFVPFAKVLASGKKDDALLDLYGTASGSLGREIVQYALSINLTSPAAIKTACRALASSDRGCRLDAANWLAATVTTPGDAKTALPALIEAANRTEEINKDRNAGARAQAYEAIRRILQRMGVSEAEKLPGWRGDDEAVKLWLSTGAHVVTSPIARQLEDSAKETERREAEAAVRRACDLAQQFLRSTDASPQNKGR
jgi:hypothetical protein